MTIFSMGMCNGASLTHIDTGGLAEESELMLTLVSDGRITLLFMEIEILPEGLIVGITPDVASLVTFGGPLIRVALIVKLSV